VSIEIDCNLLTVKVDFTPKFGSRLCWDSITLRIGGLFFSTCDTDEFPKELAHGL